MHHPPAFSKGLWLGCICVVLLGVSVSSITKVLGHTETLAEPAALTLTFKQMVAQKAMEEYDRWHTNGTLRETDVSATAILKDYWKLGSIKVTEGNLRNGSWQYHHPWSAVFISWVMQQAGAGNDFPYANNHATYIVWARDNAATKADAAFAAYDVHDVRCAWPQPGDLICMNRRSNQYTLQNLNSKCISHCDIVVEVNKEQGFLIAVGGNVLQTVSKRKVWLTKDGMIDTAKNWMVMDAAENNPEGSQRDIFGVIKLHAGDKRPEADTISLNQTK